MRGVEGPPPLVIWRPGVTCRMAGDLASVRVRVQTLGTGRVGLSDSEMDRGKVCCSGGQDHAWRGQLE